MGFTAKLKASVNKWAFALMGGEEFAGSEGGYNDFARFSSYLPYRTYDKDCQLFYNLSSCGFVVELAPQLGADDRTQKTITQIFSDILLPGTIFSVTQFGSPRIKEKLSDWILPRALGGPVYSKIASYRAAKFSRGAWSTMSSDGPFCVRNYRIILSVTIKQGSKIKKNDVLAMREGIVAALSAINIPCKTFDPVNLIRLCDELTCPAIGGGDDALSYSNLDPINTQCLRPDFEMVIQRDRIITRCQSLRATGRDSEGVPELGIFSPSSFDVRSMVVRNYPDQFGAWEGQALIGSLFNTKLCWGSPVVTTFAGRVLDAADSSTKAGMKHVRSRQLADGTASRLIPHLGKQASEWEGVAQLIRIGHKLVEGFYSVNVISPIGQAEANTRTVKSIYKAAGWDLADQLNVNISSYSSMFPMNFAEGLGDFVKRMRLMRTFITTNAGALAPIHGEYVGGSIPHMLLVGRRGQPQYWSMFQNGEGNHNVAVIGKSGSGKSVFLQELCLALTGSNAQVVVIDDGRSFEHTCKAVGGRFIEFNLQSGLTVNPFRMVDAEIAGDDEDYLVDCLAMLKSIIGQMCRNESHLSDSERGVIDVTVNSVWSEHGCDGSIDAVIEILEREKSGIGPQLAMALSPFGSKGTYGRFFVGSNNIDLNNPLTVFELSDLASRDELRSVILTSIMFLSSQKMRKSPRSIPKALIIDEAWQLLKGGPMADFIETYARTCRKYCGALVTGTQSINDYYKSDGSRAALENSDWSVVLAQKPETIADLKNFGRFEMSTFTEGLIRSLKRNGTDYSDVFIRGPETEFVARLVLDKFSGALFSSSPQVFAQIEEEVKRGATMAEAIEKVAFPEVADKGYLEAAE